MGDTPCDGHFLEMVDLILHAAFIINNLCPCLTLFSIHDSKCKFLRLNTK